MRSLRFFRFVCCPLAFFCYFSACPLSLLPVPSFHAHSEDLLTLRDFSEPALLHTLRVRFSRRESYTAVGTILVSVNPYSYHNYEETYGEEVMDL